MEFSEENTLKIMMNSHVVGNCVDHDQLASPEVSWSYLKWFQ